MNKKQRVLDCIDGKPIDKVPFSFWHHYSGADNYGDSCVHAHRQIYEAADMDFIKMNSNGYYPMPFEVSVQRPEDWRHVVPPSRNSRWFQEQIDLVRRMRDAVHDEACVFYVVYAGYSFLIRSFGKELCDMHLRDPEARKEILPTMAKMTDCICELSVALLREGGATGLFEAFSSNSRFAPEEYRAWLRPLDLQQITASESAGQYNIVHLCGGVDGRNHMEVWSDYTGAVIHWDQHLDWINLAEGRVLFPNKRAIMGGFDNRPGAPLYMGQKEKIQELTRAYVRMGGRTGFLLSADCTLMPNISYEHLRWVGEALWNE